jgi:hypothetical protein
MMWTSQLISGCLSKPAKTNALSRELVDDILHAFHGSKNRAIAAVITSRSEQPPSRGRSKPPGNGWTRCGAEGEYPGRPSRGLASPGDSLLVGVFPLGSLKAKFPDPSDLPRQQQGVRLIRECFLNVTCRVGACQLGGYGLIHTLLLT